MAWWLTALVVLAYLLVLPVAFLAVVAIGYGWWLYCAWFCKVVGRGLALCPRWRQAIKELDEGEDW